MPNIHSTFRSDKESYQPKDPSTENHPNFRDLRKMKTSENIMPNAVIKKPYGSTEAAPKAEAQLDGTSGSSRVAGYNTGGLTASRWVKIPSKMVDDVRVPLKKRSPMGFPGSRGRIPKLQRQQMVSDSKLSTSTLKDGSSSFQAQTPHDPFFSTMSSGKGGQLMREPLIETPNSTTSSVWSHISGGSFAGFQPVAGTMHSKKPHSIAGASGDINWKRRQNDDQIGRGQGEQKSHGHVSTIARVPLPPYAMYPTSRQHDQVPYRYEANPIKEEPRTSVQQYKQQPVKSEELVHRPMTTGNETINETLTRFHNTVLPLNRWGPEQYDLFNNIPLSDRPCKCSNSRCLKLYCECFQQGLFCDPKLCRCKGCLNTKENNEPRGERMIAIKKILAKRPGAFGARPKKKAASKRCGCKKSGYVFSFLPNKMCRVYFFL